MKAADLDILLQEGEGAMLEYKKGLSSSFARELVALANTAGGRILLGVRDNGTVKGIPDTNNLRARIQDIARNCDPSVKILLQRPWFYHAEPSLRNPVLESLPSSEAKGSEGIRPVAVKIVCEQDPSAMPQDDKKKALQDD